MCVRVWRDRVGVSWGACFRTFRRFYREVLMRDPVFAGLSPRELVEWQIKARGKDAYRVKDLAQQWINRQRLTVKTKQKCLSYISSFFLHNHAPLPRDPSFHFTSEVPPVEGRLDLEAFRRILHNCNKMYRAVFLMMAQGLMGEGELVYVSDNHWREVLTHLTKNDGIFKLTLPGRKRNRNVKNFFTMLSTKSDWATAMRDYMKSSPHQIHGALFRNVRGRPLTSQNIQYYFHWRAVEAGVIEQFTPPCSRCEGETVRARRRHHNGVLKVAYVCKECGNVDWACEMDENFASVRYGVNPHEIRDLMRSRWRASGAKIVVAEEMMEHDIDPNEYDKMKYTPSYAEKEYRKALPWLNVLSQDPSKVDRSTVDAELERYRRESQVLRREVARLNQYVKTLEERREFSPEQQKFYEVLGTLFKKKPEKREKFMKWLEEEL